MHLAAILNNAPSPHAIGTWRLPRSFRGYDYTSASFWEDLARTLERGLFDMLFLADSFDLHDTYRDSPDTAVRYAVQYPKHDPLPLVPIVGAVTRHLGVGLTLSTTYLPPYYVARSLATLDHLTGGRIGWNIVTSYGRNEAANFGLEASGLSHDERYDRADEYVDLCMKLWGSWDADAVVADRTTGEYADPAKVHRVDHVGRYFRCQGPLQVSPSPQGHPLMIQAGSSGRGLQFAARHAELHFAVRQGAEGMRRHRAALGAAMQAAGRDPRDAVVLWGVVPIVAETESEALARQRAIVDNVPVEAGLALMSGHFNVDLSSQPLDRPLQQLDVEGVQGLLQVVTEDLADKTLAEAAKIYGSGLAPHVVGTPVQVADQLEELYEASGGDGFMIITHALPGSVADFVDLAVPELQRRGRFRLRYDETTLRTRMRSTTR